MRVRMRGFVVAGIVLALSTPLLADDLTGKDKFLCTGIEATRCTEDGDCTVAPPWAFNMPQFLIVDLKANKLSTTEASGENRSTPILHLDRQGGAIFLQGVENARAFSFVIVEGTGYLTAAVAADGLGVTVFGACTPAPTR